MDVCVPTVLRTYGYGLRRLRIDSKEPQEPRRELLRLFSSDCRLETRALHVTLRAAGLNALREKNPSASSRPLRLAENTRCTRTELAVE